ncbi:hypothetical protein [Stenotrophomonas sp.]|uniref:hypothetical protein n=1 Tax=Stenotrophomonas sp. TaxID=69392 RepID=UPI0028A08692|nr:hypothetical protein [Stenotrophomonas sp.]
MIWRYCSGLVVLLSIAPPAVAGSHVDLIDFPTNEANWDRFYDLESALMRGFDRICADTLCAGDYSNYRVMQVRCAVRLLTGRVTRCAWVVAASELRVQPVTGDVQVDNGRWVCPVDLLPGVPVEQFHTVLSGPDGVEAPFPALGRGLFDDLLGCLQAPGNAGRPG